MFFSFILYTWPAPLEKKGANMFSKVKSCAVHGVDGRMIDVEADVNDGLPVFTMVGYLSSSVRESSERV